MAEEKIDLSELLDNGLQKWTSWAPFKPHTLTYTTTYVTTNTTNPLTIPAGGTMAIPKAEPKTPTEVAKELRHQTRAMLDYLDTNAQAAKSNNYVVSAKDYLDSALDELERSFESASIARIHAKQRKAGPTVVSLDLLDARTRSARSYTQHARKALVYAGTDESSDSVLVSRTTWEAMRQMMKELQRNVQALPTSHGLPTDMAENTLRAIGVVMQNAGYVAKKDVPDGIPVAMLYEQSDDDGDEDHDQEEEEMTF